jgi:hypothetical protein
MGPIKVDYSLLTVTPELNAVFDDFVEKNRALGVAVEGIGGGIKNPK